MSAPLYAGLGRRIPALLIDNFMFLTLGSLVFGLAIGSFGPLELVLAGTVWFHYFVFCEWRWGRTIGKRFMRIRVVTEMGKPLSWNDAVVRNLTRVIDSFFAGYLVGLIMIWRSRRKQRLGDRWAGTLVVETDAEGRLRTSDQVIEQGAGSGRDPAETKGWNGEDWKPAGWSAAAPPGSDDSSAGRAVGDVGGDRVDVGRGGETGPGATPRPSASADWGVARVLQGIGALLLALFASVLLSSLVVVAAGLDPDGTVSRIFGQALLATAFIAVAFLFARPFGGATPHPSRLGLRGFRPSAIGWMFVAYFTYFALAILYSVLVTTPEQDDIARELGAGEGTLATAASALLIVGAAPLAEEIFFRGFLFAGLRSRMPLWPAAVISGAIFGLTHAPTGVAAVVPLAILGLILAWLYEKTGSLWPPIVLHMTNNAIAFAVLTG